MNVLEALKTFLSDRIEVALLAISLFVNAYLFIMYVRARNAEVRTLQTLLPLATRLSDLLTAAAARAKTRSSNMPLISSDSGIRERE